MLKWKEVFELILVRDISQLLLLTNSVPVQVTTVLELILHQALRPQTNYSADPGLMKAQ